MAIFYVAVFVEMSIEAIILIVIATITVGLFSRNRRFPFQSTEDRTHNGVDSHETESASESGSINSRSDGNEIPSNEEAHHLWCEFYEAMGDEAYDNLRNHIEK